ncbi:hypothetical protein L2E82_29440 [Cichorium intybus]|uniref:Uncharacterized protein n=1 Tax=Cichorium intybus TaxID=13427 RepID=A0ACB9CXL2_CICIN|nr:hypothetical protein L2E82_29440 [Cichorium intybus]
MMMLVNCSNCHKTLQLLSGDISITCAICQSITHLRDPRITHPRLQTGGYPALAQSSYAPPSLSSYNHTPPRPPLSVHGWKKAVIDGILYKFSRHEVKGCIND